MTIKIGVIGASGVVGRKVLEVLPEYADFQLGSAVVSPTSKYSGTSVPRFTGLEYSSDINEAVKSCEAWIDFSRPAGSLSISKLCAKFGNPIVIATTGHTRAEIEEIRAYAEGCPILLAPNTSVGIYVTHEIAKLTKDLLGPEFDIEIVESHRKGKKDAPSGTALSIASYLGGGTDRKIVKGRGSLSGDQSKSGNEIGIASIRAGDIFGEHTIYFAGASERIEITHRISDRAVFARGALVLLSKLMNKPPGLYSPKDLYQ